MRDHCGCGPYSFLNFYPNVSSRRAFSWFVKVPKSPTTSALDATETFMYNVLFPALQTFADQHYRGANSGDVMRMPIPAVFHAHYDAGRPEGNHLVMQDLGDSNFQQIKPGGCRPLVVSVVATVIFSGLSFLSKQGPSQGLMILCAGCSDFYRWQ